MEQQSLVLLNEEPITVFASLSDHQRDFVATIKKLIMLGDLDVALEIITFDSFGERVLPPLEHSIIKRVVLRLQHPSQPEIYLDQVDMDARYLNLVGDSMTVDTLRKLYISVFTTSFNHIQVELMRRILSLMHDGLLRQNELKQRSENLNLVRGYSKELVALNLFLFFVILCILSVFM